MLCPFRSLDRCPQVSPTVKAPVHRARDNGRPHIRSKKTTAFPLEGTTNLPGLQDAVSALNTLQSNFTVVDAVRKSGRGMNKNAIPEMIEWCQRIGYEV